MDGLGLSSHINMLSEKDEGKLEKSNFQGDV